MTKKTAFTATAYDSFAKRPAIIKMVLDAHAEMIEQNIVDLDYGISIELKQHVVALYAHNKLVGVCTFYPDNENNYWISLSYVKPAYRKRGGWKLMREVVAEAARAADKPYVMSGVFCKNKTSMAANSRYAIPVMTVFKQDVR